MSLYKHKFKTKIIIHILSAFMALFLSFYGVQVCPFMSKLDLVQIFKGLLIVFLIQIFLRESIDFILLKKNKYFSPPRTGYYISIITWLIAGIVAVIIHHFRYPEFPLGSHIKMLIGYWSLGGGIFSQLEYVLFEKEYRERAVSSEFSNEYNEPLARRIFEGYLVFTAVPVLTLIMAVSHYVYRGYVAEKVKMEAMYLGVFFVITAIYIAWRIGLDLKSDTRKIISGLSEVENGNFNPGLDESRLDELGHISHGFNSMAAGLKERDRIKKTFGKFVSPEIARDIINNIVKSDKDTVTGGSKKKVVILYSDIRDFTPLSETLEPEILMDLLCRYFTEMVNVIRKHNGIVDKFIGDAIMAVFGISEEHPYPEIDALLAAREMNHVLSSFNMKQAQNKNNELKIGIGIHSGEVIAGFLGSNDRMEFTVIGNAVNIASRVEGQTKPPNPNLLFTSEIAEACKEFAESETSCDDKNVIRSLNIRKAVTADLKGVSTPMDLFTIMNSPRGRKL